MDSPAGIVVDCSECHRTIWANSVCHHGWIPPPSDATAPVEPGITFTSPPPYKSRRNPKLKGGLG